MRHDSSTGHWIRLPGKGRRRALPFGAAAMAIVLATAISALAITRTAAPASAASSSRPAYLDARLPTQARVADLVGRMTLPEKIGQLVQIEATQVTDKTNACTSTGGFNLPNPVCEQKIFIDDNAGSILAGGTDIPPDTTGKGGPGNTGTPRLGQNVSRLPHGKKGDIVE